MATTATVTLSDEEKEIILEALDEYEVLYEPIAEKLRTSDGALEFAPEEMEIMLDALDDYGDIFGEQEESIAQKLEVGSVTLGRTWTPS
jgi:hypothetical protein